MNEIMVENVGSNDCLSPLSAEKMIGAISRIRHDMRKAGLRCTGDSILTSNGHFTNGFDENNQPIDFKIGGNPVGREEYYSRMSTFKPHG